MNLPLSGSETSRQQVLSEYSILDTLPEQDYDELTQLASQICQTPISLITLVDDTRQWFKSAHGLAVQETPREGGFCTYTVSQPLDLSVIEDARINAQFAQHPLVTGDPHIVFYAGAPLVDEQGVALGSLCVIDNKPRQLSQQQRSALQVLAKQVVNLLTLRRQNTQLRVSEQQYELEKAALAQSEARFRTLIEEAPLATSLFEGRQLRVAVANAPMLAIWGKGPHQVGRTLAEILPEIANQPFLAILDEVYTSGITYSARGARADLVIDGVPGTYYYDFVYKPLRNATGQVYAILQMADDVTERKLTEVALQESEERYRQLAQSLEQQVQDRTQELTLANQDLQRSNDNLQQFAYVASHDLQEPLRKIQSFSSLLQEKHGEAMDQEATDYLTRISLAGARMSTLIKDLLAYSRIATRQQTFGPVSLGNILDDVVTTLDWEIQQAQAQLTIDELPIVRGDSSQLTQLFQNLLTNALKFVLPGQPPRIRVQYVYQPDSELPPALKLNLKAPFYHQISVSDQGIGFEEKYVDRIFQVFQRLHGRQAYPGTGVGLAICQRVVENHGGAITATSKPNEGATFRVYLPA